MIYFYPRVLSPTSLLASLSTTLKYYPFYAGRYTPPPSTPLPFPISVDLNNAGVPVEVTESTKTFDHATSYLSTVHSKTDHEAFTPAKPPMDPDSGSPTSPILSIKITTLKDGTAISILFQHYVSDAQGGMMFMTHWSQIHSGLPPSPLPPPPLQDRDILPTAAAPLKEEETKLIGSYKAGKVRLDKDGRLGGGLSEATASVRTNSPPPHFARTPIAHRSLQCQASWQMPQSSLEPQLPSILSLPKSAIPPRPRYSLPSPLPTLSPLTT